MIRLLCLGLYLFLSGSTFYCVAQSGQIASIGQFPASFTSAVRAPKFAGTSGVRKVYTHQQFTKLARQHRVMAVLPVDVTIEAEETTIQTANQLLQDRALAEANNAYHTLYAALLVQKSFRHAAINFQDINITRQLLSDQHITPAMIKNMSPVSLAALLGVDGVIICQIVRDKKLVMEASIIQNLKRSKGLIGPSAGVATCAVHDGKTGQLLWQFDRQLTERLGWNITQTITNLSRGMADAFPYFRFF